MNALYGSTGKKQHRNSCLRFAGLLLGALVIAGWLTNPAFSMGFFSKKEKPKEETSAVKKPVAPPPKEEILVTGAEILRFGLLEAEVDKIVQEDASKQAPAAKGDGQPEPIKKILLKYYKFSDITDKIPAKRGVFFGFEYKLLGKPEGKAVVVTLQDEIRVKTDNEIVAATPFTTNVAEETKIGEVNLVAFQFKEREDLFSGAWTFRLMHNDQKLAEKAFLIEKPEIGTPHFVKPGQEEKPEDILPEAPKSPTS